jgi:dienelactone hydrolase
MKSIHRSIIAGALFLTLVAMSCNTIAAEAITAKEDDGSKKELVAFPCGEMKLQGWLYKPEGTGPFPTIVYNHGSDKVPGWFPNLGKFYTEKGYVFFVPHRHGHGRSPGEYIVDLQEKFRAEHGETDVSRKHDIELHELYNKDVVAAVAWIKQQPFVKKDDVYMSGISYGGIQTILSCEKDLGLKACISFAPAAMSWEGNPLLRQRLLTAVKHAKVPVFLLQAQNDYNLGPTQLLGAELNQRGAPNRSKLYPVFGPDPENHQAGHGGFAVSADGIKIWAPDVLAFISEVSKTGSRN